MLTLRRNLLHRCRPRQLVVAAAVCLLLPVACQKTKAKEQAEGASGALGTQSEDELDEVIATVDGVKITVREVQDQINKQSPFVRPRFTSLEQKKDFLDNLIRFEVLAKEAAKRKYDQHPEVVRTMKQVMIQRLIKEEFENKIDPEEISDDELKAFYEKNGADYNKPEEIRVSAIIVSNRGDANKAAVEAKSEAGKTNKGFRQLVAKHSTDEKSKIRGGDLQYFRVESEELPKPVIEAAFKLAKTGDVAGPIDAGDGTFYVIKQTGKRKALTKDFESVKRQIKNRLYRDKRTQAQQDFIANLKKNAKITINDEALKKVRVDTSKAAEGEDEHGH